jgi:hypothetical protein
VVDILQHNYVGQGQLYEVYLIHTVFWKLGPFPSSGVLS